MICGLATASGQKTVRIELYGLYRAFEPMDKYVKFNQLYSDLRSKHGNTIYYQGYQINLHDEYILLPVELIEKILSENH